jgi:hypothetical protein
LRAVEVECTQRAGVSDARWKKWQRSISTMLLGQNVTIGDALALFKASTALYYYTTMVLYYYAHGTYLLDYRRPEWYHRRLPRPHQGAETSSTN